MKITVALLIYKSPAYLDFVMKSLLEHHSTEHEVEYLIVCNDATDEVIIKASEYSSYLSHNYDPKIRIVSHRNEDPSAYWLDRVYQAWNRCMTECETEAICFVNSDMFFIKGWLDSLAKYDLDKYIPTSRLVESERMPSLPGLISKNFGQTLAEFKRDEFESFANSVKEDKALMHCGAYMPSLFKTETIKSVGGWSKNQGGWPGDKITFARLKNMGIEHIMVCNSIVYHFQRSESIESGDPQ